jgi:putative transposase
VKFAFIEAEKAGYPIVVLCDVLGVSCSGYYAWKGRPASARAQADAALVVDIRASYAASRGTYGSTRVHRDLQAGGRRIGKNRVARVMQREGIQARRKRRFRRTTDSNHTFAIAPNILERNFDVALPNTAWVGDVTYVWTLEGWLYLAVIVDLFSRRVVGWATSANNDRALALKALKHATMLRAPARGWVHHTDRGSVYASNDYGDALDDLGAIKSMSRKADCWDNAVAESFFATIKGEMIEHESFETRAEATAAIADYIDGFYNTRRRHSSLDYVSPIEYELNFSQPRVTT